MFFKAIEEWTIQTLDLAYMDNHDQLKKRRDLDIVTICSESYFAVIFSIEVSVALIKKLVKALINTIEVGKNEGCALFYTTNNLVDDIESLFRANVF